MFYRLVFKLGCGRQWFKGIDFFRFDEFVYYVLNFAHSAAAVQVVSRLGFDAETTLFGDGL